MLRRPSIALTLLLWILSAVAIAQPTEEVLVVRVVPVNDPRLPVLSRDETHELLRIASTMIWRSYGRRLNFDLQPPEPLPKWFDDQWTKIAPYEIPHEYRADLFDDDLKRFEQAAFTACRMYGTVEQLRNLVGEERRSAVTNHATAARELLEQYKLRRAGIRDRVLADGSKLIPPKDRRRFSQSHWAEIFVAAADIREPEVYLTNILLVDDFLIQPAPHALASSLAYAFVYPSTNRIVVTTYPMLAPDADLLPPTVGGLSAAERKLLIPYCVAHEVGTHLVLEVWDSYADDGGLARPIFAIRDPSIIAKYDDWPGARTDLKMIDWNEQRLSVMSHRLDIAIARKDRPAAERALQEAIELNPPDDQIREMGQRYDEAKWD